MTPGVVTDSAEEIKQCCALLYESDAAKLLLGDSFHPGGSKLTERLGSLLHLSRESRVLDVASGSGASAIFLARRFGCQVVGVDLSLRNVTQANEKAGTEGLASLVQFQHSDAERLAVADARFDAVICECAFCIFPDKQAAAQEFARVLRPGGMVGISDLTRSAALDDRLRGLLAWVACIADAQPADRYAGFLEAAGLRVGTVESHDEALIAMTDQIRMRLLGAELMVGLKKLALPAMDFEAARELLRTAREAVHDGQLGYVVLAATKPGPGGGKAL